MASREGSLPSSKGAFHLGTGNQCGDCIMKIHTVLTQVDPKFGYSVPDRPYWKGKR